MDIFVLDKNPKLAAKFHCDKHVIKMTLETAQLLCSVYWANEIDAPYKSTHINHPCAIWARESYWNFIWLSQLGISLGNEYTNRYNRTHKSVSVINWCFCSYNMSKIKFPKIVQTPFVLCMPEKYITNDPVESYRNFYRAEKSKFAKWKTGNVPLWWRDETNKN